MTLPAEGPNAQQISYWNEQSGPKWVRRQSQLDLQLEALGHAGLARACLAPGEKVIDVGCGCGQTTLQIAEQVGTTGEALGLDLSAVMLARARERALDAGASQVRFENADAQTVALPAPYFDVVFSRFGVMFFANPVAAFANLRRALRPGGRLAFVCWQEIQRNPWLLVPVMATAQQVPLPAPPAPGEPGPFSFADPERVRRILSDAGFDRIDVDAHEGDLSVGGSTDLDFAVEFAMEVGPAAGALREAGEEARPRVAAAIREALAPYATREGVRLGFAAWIVTARKAEKGTLV